MKADWNNPYCVKRYKELLTKKNLNNNQIEFCKEMYLQEKLSQEYFDWCAEQNILFAENACY